MPASYDKIYPGLIERTTTHSWDGVVENPVLQGAASQPSVEENIFQRREMVGSGPDPPSRLHFSSLKVGVASPDHPLHLPPRLPPSPQNPGSASSQLNLNPAPCKSWIPNPTSAGPQIVGLFEGGFFEYHSPSH